MEREDRLHKRILIADENPTEGSMLGQTLVSEGFVVLPVRDLPTLLAKASAFKPDVILLGVRDPARDGAQAAAALAGARATAGIPLVLLSGAIAPDAPRTRPKEPGRYYVAKPVERIALAALLRAITREG